MATPLWARLDVRHFVSLTEVARTGSFTAAAQSLGYTQSAISQQISRLERQIGQRLVNRSSGGKSISLTPSGRLMLSHGHALTTALQRAAADVTALSSGMAGILRVGCFESVGTALLPETLAIFDREFPRTQVVLTELANDGGLLDAIEADDLDLSFVVFPMAEGQFDYLALLEEPYVLVVGRDSPLAQEDAPVELDDHPDLQLMGYADVRSVHALENRLGRPDYGHRVVFRSDHHSTLLSLARHGYAGAVLPRLALSNSTSDEVVTLPLANVSPRVIGIAWHRNRPLGDAANGFVRAAGRAAQKHAAQDGP